MKKKPLREWWMAVFNDGYGEAYTSRKYARIVREDCILENRTPPKIIKVREVREVKRKGKK